MNTRSHLGSLFLLVLAAAGCATQPPASQASAPTAAQAAAPAAEAAKVLFVVLPDTGRVHAFGDTKNYFDFLAHGEVQLTRTRIGEGPGGKTMVYGITDDDVKRNQPSLGERIMSGTLAPASDFYGEVFKGGRYYVFGDLKDLKDFTAFGEVPYSYTDIGVGLKGETLVYVMNKDSYPKGKPQSRVDRFKALRAGLR